MIIYNTKELTTHYMQQDELVIEIRSTISIDEMLTKLRAGEEISEDVATIAAYKTGEGQVVTQAEFLPEEAAEFGYDSVLDAEDMEELEEAAENNNRPKIFQAFEGYQFNRPWRSMPFEPCEITKEQLLTQLYAVQGIMPTIKDIPEKNITELKQMSASGDRLYWSFTKVSHNNALPNRSDIEFYESLSDYEKRIINESGVHPMKMLNIARGIKEGDPGRLLTRNDENAAHLHDAETVIVLSKTPGLTPFTYRISRSKKDMSILSWLKNEKGVNVSGYPPCTFITDVEANFASRISTKELSEIHREYLQKASAGDDDAEIWHENEVKKCFYKHMFDERVAFDKALHVFQGSNVPTFIRELVPHYDALYTQFVKEHTRTDETQNETVIFTEEDMISFAKKSYAEPVPSCIKKADEVFKELFHGHAPRVLSEYMHAQFLAKGIEPANASEEQIREIASAFDQKNVSKVARNKNLVLFALADELNFNEVKTEHLQAFAIFIKPTDIRNLLGKGFVEWYKAHKDVSLSALVELLDVCTQIEKFEEGKSAKELVEDIYFKKGKADCKKMEEKYGYSFSDNELAIRGRHIVAQEGKVKMYMLQKDDYRNFTVGYDTHCCQHYGNAGESCVWKLTTDPFAGCVVIERDGNILAQGFVWTDEAQDTLVFDNVEFADDRKVSQFNSLFAAWSRAMPYKNIHVGTGYNQSMHSWGKKITYSAKIPTTLSDRHIYSDYHNDARSLKADGVMQISEKNVVKVTTKPDEPTRWDELARPETAFLLNDCHSSIESRMEFARNFLHEQTPEIQLEAVRRNPLAIQYIEHPTEEVQRHVIRANPKHAVMIKEPCREVQRILIDMDPAYIRNIQNPNEDMAIKAVTQNGLLLGDIANPSDVVKRLAVEQNGYAIRFVENPSEALELAAVKTSPKVVSLIPNASSAVLKAAIDKDPTVVSLVQSPSPDIQKYAVSKKPYVINSIENPDYEAVKKAIEKEGLLIRSFQFAYPHLREVAIKQNPFAIRALKNPTDEEYVLAVSKNRAVASIIRDPALRASVLAAVDERNTEKERE